VNLEISKTWKSTYPGATAGILHVRNVISLSAAPELEKRRLALEEDLRARYASQDKSVLAALPAIQAYRNYYKRFDKTYHVLLQLESVVYKGKSIPQTTPLVEAMFLAELQDLLLTAGHDAGALQPPIGLSIAGGSERYTLLRGEEQQLKQEDMFIQDAAGVISSVIYGPDQRTRITPQTSDVLYTTYGAPGISAQSMRAHLETLRSNVLSFCPQAQVETLEVFSAE
jgi:DNA/RNA-binding domain of Phe-tRNA-synthetase-like protein